MIGLASSAWLGHDALALQPGSRLGEHVLVGARDPPVEEDQVVGRPPVAPCYQAIADAQAAQGKPAVAARRSPMPMCARSDGS